ncbi:MAG TPA: hypothetical protein GX699_07545 [Firmicutes bacterium]|nr:hypothetical protein [Bacillota bacterium]
MEIRDIMRIAAFLPEYQSGAGQSVYVFFRDGTTGWLQVGMRSFLRQIARAFTVNLQEARKQYGPLIGKSNLVPLVLSPFLLYVPLKTRKPLIPGDPAYGYFRLRSVIEVAAHPAPCTLTLEGGNKLTIIQSYRTVCSHLRAARKLEAYLLEQFCDMADPEIVTAYLQHTGVQSDKQQ